MNLKKWSILCNIMSLEFTNPEKCGNGYVVKVTKDDAPVYLKLHQVTVDPENWTVHGVQNPEFQSIDEEIKQGAKENRKSWFGRDLADSTLNKAFNQSLQDGQLDVKPPRGGPQLWGDGNNEITMEEFNPEVPCSVILQFVGIWFLQKAYGAMYRVIQIKQTTPRPPKVPVQCMFDDDPEDVEEDEDEDDLGQFLK